MRAKDIPLPHRWPHLVRQAMIHAASLAHCDILYAWSKAENASAPTACLKGQIDKLQTELAQSQNQNRILMARFGRISPQRLPNYSPTERMEILAHKSACGWNLQQTAEAFMLSENTISSWMKRIDDEKLVSLPAPWNKYPDFLKGMAQTLKRLVPRMGKKKIAEYFARSGLYLAANTIGRYLKSEAPINPEDLEVSEDDPESKSISADYPDHVWSLDLTAVPTLGGFWTSLIPNSLSQVWPYCWWVLVIIDHFSRNAVGFALFKKSPTSEEVTEALERSIARTGRKPKHIISDKGAQFYCDNYKGWCLQNNMKTRFGAVGRHGSVAVTERLVKTLKVECTRLISIPLNFKAMRYELALFFSWYNEFRTHEYLGARTPMEIYNHSPPSEPPLKLVHASEVPKLELHVSYLDGRKHLPVIDIQKAA